MKKGLFAIIQIIIILIINIVYAFSGSGSGTPSNPYVITNCTQLAEMSNSVSSSYILNNNIDCSDTINWYSGAG